MKYSVLICGIAFLAVMMIFASCTLTGEQENAGDSQTDIPATEEPVPSEEEKTEEKEEPGIFSLHLDGTFLTLRQWDYEMESALEQLGSPLNEETRQLENADTFTGSWLKIQEFEGLELEWFSPEDNGEDFWLMSMKVTGSKYQCNRGIRKGSSREELMDTYPELETYPDGRTDPDNSAYILSEQEEYNHLVFEVENGEVISMHFYHLMP